MPHTHTKHTILVSDSAEIFVAGLAKTVRNISPEYVTLHARNNCETESLLKHTPIDLVVFELNLLSATFIRQLHANYPDLKLVGYGSIRNCIIIKEFIKQGLNAYLFKNDPKKEFITAIKMALGGKLYFGQEVQGLINNNIFCDKLSVEEFLEAMMNERFREILYLIYNEFTIKQIASELSLSIKTIEGYRSRMLRIIGASNMVGLALFAERHQIHHELNLRNKFKIKERMYIDS